MQSLKIANTRAEIPTGEFPPFWRDVLPEMLESYRRICAYLSLYINCGTGSPTVDHFIPKSTAWDQVYEWSNYRLASSVINGKKGSLVDCLDPFHIENGDFALEFTAFQVLPGPTANIQLSGKVLCTIEKLGLNMRECCEARREYVEAYESGSIDLAYFERRAPFIAQELRRQGLLQPRDV